MKRALDLAIGALAAIGLGLVLCAAAAWFARDDLTAWYRSLPVVIAAKSCPG